MGPHGAGRGIAISSAAGTYPVKEGPGVVLSISFLGGAGAIVGLYDGLDVATGTLRAVYTGLNTTIPVAINPNMAFEVGCVVAVSGTFTGAFITLTIE
jgi:hypothetical protein